MNRFVPAPKVCPPKRPLSSFALKKPGAPIQRRLTVKGIDLSVALKHNISKGILTLDLESTDGVEAGKALLQLFEQEGIDITNCHTVNINVKGPVDLQFITMYLSAPPGVVVRDGKAQPLFFKRFGANVEPPNRQVNIILHNNAAADQIYSLITNSIEGACGTMQDIPSPLFQANVKFHVPKGNRSLLIARARSAARLLEKILPEKYHAELGNNLTKIEAYLSARVVKNRSLRPSRAQSRTTDRGIDKVPQLHLEKLGEGYVVAATSDESFHVSLKGKQVVVVDAGNPSSARYIMELAEKNEASGIQVFLTHFHRDHVNGLPKLLQAAEKAKAKVVIHIPEGTLFQSMGFFGTHLPALRKLAYSENVRLKVLPPAETAKVNSDTTVSMVEPHPSIKHFIYSAGYIEVDTKGKTARAYTGDINPGPFNPRSFKPYTAEEVRDGLYAYFSNFISRAKAKGAKKIDLFVDYGHFPPDQQANIRSFFNRDLGIELAPHFEHIKDNHGYTLEVAGLIKPEPASSHRLRSSFVKPVPISIRQQSA